MATKKHKARARRNAPTPDQRRARSEMCMLAAAWNDLTYAAKFGAPALRKKVFIRLQQMKDYLGSVVYATSAIVPAEEAWDSEAEGA